MNSSTNQQYASVTSDGASSMRSRRWTKSSLRGGALLSIEMMMLLSILIPLTFAITEFSLLWSARHSLEAATYEAARAAAMPSPDDDARRLAAEEAADRVLGDADFIRERIFTEFDAGSNSDPYVTVEISLPMTAAAPDLLKIIGLSIEGKLLVARTVTRRE